MKKHKIVLAVLCPLLIVAAVGVTVFILTRPQPKEVRLDSEYYATSEAISINKDEYEQLIRDKKSFVVMVDKPGCYTTENMRGFMANFPDDVQFRYYRLLWDDAKETNLHEKVKYTPSVAIIREGEVVAFLDADADEDTARYNSADALEEWLREYIAF